MDELNEFDVAINLTQKLISDGYGINRNKIITVLQEAKEISLAYEKLLQEPKIKFIDNTEIQIGFALKIGKEGEWIQFIAIPEDRYLELIEVYNKQE